MQRDWKASRGYAGLKGGKGELKSTGSDQTYEKSNIMTSG